MLLKNGLILIDKPDGMTSHDVVNYIRRKLDTKRVGHTGTLDPLATGLLVMLIGRGTLLSSWLTGMNKRYAARFVFGAVTDTYDIEGEIVSSADPGQISHDDFEKVLAKYRGEIEQVIPPFSAVKRAGKTMHKLARNGKDFNPGLKAVEINRLELIDFAWPEVVVDIGCSSGTYIRSLAHQMGQELGCGGYLKALRRLEVGPFSISEADTLENICRSREPEKYIRPLKDAMPAFPSLHIKLEHCDDVSGGRPLAKKFFSENEYRGDGEELSLLLDQDENLLALARMNISWHDMEELSPAQVIGSYVRVIDEGHLRTD
jgi:tRNA pseudouridine55 synthase